MTLDIKVKFDTSEIRHVRRIQAGPLEQRCHDGVSETDDDDETEKPTSSTLKTCEWEQYGIEFGKHLT